MTLSESDTQSTMGDASDPVNPVNPTPKRCLYPGCTQPTHLVAYRGGKKQCRICSFMTTHPYECKQVHSYCTSCVLKGQPPTNGADPQTDLKCALCGSALVYNRYCYVVCDMCNDDLPICEAFSCPKADLHHPRDGEGDSITYDVCFHCSKARCNI